MKQMVVATVCSHIPFTIRPSLRLSTSGSTAAQSTLLGLKAGKGVLFVVVCVWSIVCVVGVCVEYSVCCWCVCGV